jgi:hypothetical protein
VIPFGNLIVKIPLQGLSWMPKSPIAIFIRQFHAIGYIPPDRLLDVQGLEARFCTAFCFVNIHSNRKEVMA